MSAFDLFRQDLDSYNDRRESLIKASRDVTNSSKKIIFLLHRIVTEDLSDHPTLLLRAREKLGEVQTSYAAMKDQLQGDLYWRHQRQVSPGLQEYIEALSFTHYLEHGSLIKFDQVQDTLRDSDGVPYFPLTVSDYLLGLSDLTGELMRFAISGITRRGGRTKANEICVFVRNCKADFERFTPYIRDLSKKQAVTAQSLEKIEDAAYAIAVRSSEYDLPQDILDDIVAQSISSYGHEFKGRRRDNDNDDEYDQGI